MHKTFSKIIRVIGWNLLIICSLALSIYFYNFFTKNYDHSDRNTIKEMFEEHNNIVRNNKNK